MYLLQKNSFLRAQILVYDVCSKFLLLTFQNIEICKLCFGGGYHDQHEFLMRPSPDKDWECGFRGSHTNYNEDYTRLLQELQNREISPEDYETLLSLETRSNVISLAKFLALGFEKANPLPQSYF